MIIVGSIFQRRLSLLKHHKLLVRQVTSLLQFDFPVLLEKIKFPSPAFALFFFLKNENILNPFCSKLKEFSPSKEEKEHRRIPNDF